ncbi:aldehyde dehydrogenase A [Escherichia coli]|uniref:Aldehyde dehydrogenase A n=1 Tax=Escherichia coli TaxID=562 RepID=A0A376VJN7_ECOLX|nr:aldehyde dehydrogenase A [Escherichia coli]
MSVPVQHPMYIDGQFVTWRGDAWIDVVTLLQRRSFPAYPMVRRGCP